MSGLASIALAASVSSSVSFGGRPPVRPARRAAARPAWVRSRIRLRSIEEADLYQTATGPEGGLLCTSGDCGALTASSPAPVPEPSTWAMMLLGFAVLGYARYRR